MPRNNNEKEFRLLRGSQPGRDEAKLSSGRKRSRPWFIMRGRAACEKPKADLPQEILADSGGCRGQKLAAGSYPSVIAAIRKNFDDSIHGYRARTS